MQKCHKVITQKYIGHVLIMYFIFCFSKKKVRTSDSQVLTSKTFALLPEANHLVSSQKLLI